MARRGNVETLLVLKLQPIAVDTGSLDRDGMLIIANGLLVGVLVRLDAPEHAHPGYWFLEAGFGCVAQERNPLFEDLEQAQAWFATR